MMSDWIILTAPGALSYIISVKFSGRKTSSAVEAFFEWLFLCGLDTGLLWLLSGSGEELTVQELAAAATGAELFTGLLCGIAVGIAASFFRQLTITVWAERQSPGLWEKLSPRAKKAVHHLCVFALMLLLLLAILWPRIRQGQQEAQEAAYREHVLTAWQELQEKLDANSGSGEDAQNPGDVKTSVLTVRQVNKDQGWSGSGSGLPYEEAVYMVDGEGTLVYFSFRDESHGTTWSGPSSDTAFISSNKGWNGGMGFGWTGYKVQ